MSTSKCTRRIMLRALLEVEVSKKCTPLWQNVPNTLYSDHLWKRCRKSARRCGAKQISKSKVLKSDGFGGALFDVQVSFCVAGAKDSAPCQK